MKQMLILVTLLVSNQANAQWKEVADFPNVEYVTSVYFLDFPGATRIGFVGTQSELHKTTDGGNTWHAVWDSGGYYAGYYVTDICFMDTETGWFTVHDDGAILGDQCYRTSDGGETWQRLYVPGAYYSTADGIFYSSSSGKLLLLDSIIRISTDMGNTWSDSLLYYGEIYAAWSPSHIVIPAQSFLPPYDASFLETMNGGITWDTINPQNTDDGGGRWLAIPGTSTCFEVDYGWYFFVRRSDDYGHTWYPIANLTGDSLHYCTGIIKGDFSRLYIQTDTGMYVSVDSGVTWNFDGGPTYLTNFSNDEFYSANGVTIAGETYNQYGGLYGGGLWEEIWPQAGVAENASANSNNTLSIFPNPASGTLQIMGAQPGEVHLFDLLGREVLHGVLSASGTLTLDVSSLPAGLYYISDGVTRAKFVKE